MPIFCCRLFAHAYFSSVNEFGKGSDYGIHILGQLCGCSWRCSVRIGGSCFDTLHDVCNGANALANDGTFLCLTFFFHQNGANSHGGALAIIAGSAEIQSSNFTTNAAADSFPAIYDGGGTILYLDCNVQENMERDFEAVKDSFAKSQNKGRQQATISSSRSDIRPLEDKLDLAGRPPR